MAPKANAPTVNGEPPLPEENDDDLNEAPEPEPTVPLAQVLRMIGELVNEKHSRLPRCPTSMVRRISGKTGLSS